MGTFVPRRAIEAMPLAGIAAPMRYGLGMAQGGKAKLKRGHLVQATAEKMRALIFAQPPDTQIGSLPEVARQLGVGIVTVQQAARVLEHEGLLEVRRGPGGGYYGTRPDEAALERAIAAYMRGHGEAYLEALDMMALLNCELVAAAAASGDEAQRERLRALEPAIDTADSEDLRVAFEQDLQAILFRMNERPFVELLTRVTMSLYKRHPVAPLLRTPADVDAWKAGRHRLVRALLDRDPELARFEAVRNREQLARYRRAQAEATA